MSEPDEEKEGVEAEYDTAAPPDVDDLPDRKEGDEDVPVTDFDEEGDG